MQPSMESPLTLEAVAERFAQWRRGKKKGERIPEPLWHEAVERVDTYGVSQVSRVLRLGGRDLNKRRGVSGSGRRRRRRMAQSTAFVEVERGSPTAPDSSSPSCAVWVELERPDGVRLRIHGDPGLDLSGLIGRFLEAPACCS
jgi:hypothetical protein